MGILTNREKDYLLCLLKGYSNKDIQKKLFVAEGTVYPTLNKIYEKLQVSNTNNDKTSPRVVLIRLIKKALKLQYITIEDFLSE